MKKVILLNILIPILLLGINVNYAESGEKLKFAIENLQTDETTYDTTWAVKGMARNKEDRPVRNCYVVIKFKNEKGDILHSAMTALNSSDTLQPGQAAKFEYWTDSSDFDGVTNFSVWVEAFGDGR